MTFDELWESLWGVLDIVIFRSRLHGMSTLVYTCQFQKSPARNIRSRLHPTDCRNQRPRARSARLAISAEDACDGIVDAQILGDVGAPLVEDRGDMPL